MQVSAEIRVFWHGEPPRGFQDWFLGTAAHGTAVGGGSTRVDEYVSDPQQADLGLKVRGGKTGVEVKGLIAVIPDALRVPPFAGPIELWGKWTSEWLQLRSIATVSIEKQRWLRTFDTATISPVEVPLDGEEEALSGRPLPVLGCHVELAKIRRLPNEDAWWTYGLEAFGTLETAERALRAVATVLAARHCPALGNPLVASYPRWLISNGKAPP